MASVIPKCVEALQRFLEDRDYVAQRWQESTSFGDRLVEFLSADLAVRVVRDRGQWSLDVSAVHGSGEWFDAALWRALLEESESSAEFEIEAACDLFQRRHQAIRRSLSESQVVQTESALRRLGEERAERWLSAHTRKER